MAEKNLDFDTVVDRRNRACVKYDMIAKTGRDIETIPLWIADMDFKVSSYIQDALQEINDHGVYGYNTVVDGYFESVKAWMKKRHNWNIDEKWIVTTPGVVYALKIAIKAFTKIGESVLIQEPVYHQFAKSIGATQRRMVVSNLVVDDKGNYSIDFEDFEKKIVDENVKLFIMCSPHNPVGRVWTKEELEKLGDICIKHDVLVISDEIHFDFDYEREHVVFAAIKDQFKENCIVCTAPSKSFNIAGLSVSNIIIPNMILRRQFKKEIEYSGGVHVSIQGLAGCKAAYDHGEEWFDAVKVYIKDNYNFIKDYLNEHLPLAIVSPLEGTYLAWVNFEKYGLADEELNHIIKTKARVWLSPGNEYGEIGKGYQRINLACPRKVLEDRNKGN